MLKFARNILALAGTVTVIACASQSHERAAQPTGQPPEITAETDETTPPRRDIPEVMHAKLAHAQAILEGIALSDFPQIEINARDLRRISLGSEWLVMNTASYHGFSEEFRRVCDDLVNHARDKNLFAVTQDYSNLTNTCVSCHSYLRSERPFLNMPGRVSMADHAQRQMGWR